jgi:hypothetical protein
MLTVLHNALGVNIHIIILRIVQKGMCQMVQNFVIQESRIFHAIIIKKCQNVQVTDVVFVQPIQIMDLFAQKTLQSMNAIKTKERKLDKYC